MTNFELSLKDTIEYLNLYSSHKTFLSSDKTPSWESVMKEALRHLKELEDYKFRYESCNK